MDVANEDKAKFLMITSILDSLESAVVEPGSLSMEIIEQVFKYWHPYLPLPSPNIIWIL